MKRVFIIILTILTVFPQDMVGRERKVKYANGDYYVGEWKRKAPQGYGVMKYANGDEYDGHWDAGLYSGKGIYTKAGGSLFTSIYSGDWVAGVRHGQGKESSFAIGVLQSEYDGGWKDDQRSGYGVEKTDSYTYEGNWEKGNRSGKGKMHNNNQGIDLEGRWEKGAFVEGSAYNRKTGIKYTGKFYVNGSIMKGRMDDGNSFMNGDWKNQKLYSGVVKVKNDVYAIDGVMVEGVFKGTIEALKDHSVFIGMVAQHVAEGSFRRKSIQFDGRFEDWFPKNGRMVSPTAISDVYTSDSKCFFSYNGKTGSISLTSADPDAFFEDLINAVNNDGSASVYNKYLKNKRFVNDSPVYEAIHAREYLYFLENGQVAHIWNNYIAPRPTEKKGDAKKGSQTCPACHGKGYNVGHDFDFDGHPRETYNRCPLCLGLGIVDSDNPVASLLSDFQKDVQYSAWYGSLYKTDENGNRVYWAEEHGEDLYKYTINGDKIKFNGNEYTLNQKTGNLSRKDDVYIYDQTTPEQIREALRKANLSLDQRSSPNVLRETMLAGIQDLLYLDDQTSFVDVESKLEKMEMTEGPPVIVWDDGQQDESLDSLKETQQTEIRPVKAEESFSSAGSRSPVNAKPTFISDYPHTVVKIGAGSLILTQPSQFYCLGGSLGLYNMGDSRMGIEFGAYTFPGLSSLSSSLFEIDASLVLRASHAVYPKMGVGYFTYKGASESESPVHGLCAGAGLTFLLGGHLCLELGAKYYPEICGHELETVRTTPGITYEILTKKQIFTAGIAPFVSVGWAF